MLMFDIFTHKFSEMKTTLSETDQYSMEMNCLDSFMDKLNPMIPLCRSWQCPKGPLSCIPNINEF